MTFICSSSMESGGQLPEHRDGRAGVTAGVRFPTGAGHPNCWPFPLFQGQFSSSFSWATSAGIAGCPLPGRLLPTAPSAFPHRHLLAGSWSGTAAAASSFPRGGVRGSPAAWPAVEVPIPARGTSIIWLRARLSLPPQSVFTATAELFGHCGMAGRSPQPRC